MHRQQAASVRAARQERRATLLTPLSLPFSSRPLPPRLQSGKKMQQLVVKPETALVRPFVVAAVLRGVRFDPVRYDSFIDLQDKLHQNLCRQRALVAIGTHDLGKVQGPFTYEALPPQDIKFVPLKQTREFRADELMDVSTLGGLGPGVWVMMGRAGVGWHRRDKEDQLTPTSCITHQPPPAKKTKHNGTALPRERPEAQALRAADQGLVRLPGDLRRQPHPALAAADHQRRRVGDLARHARRADRVHRDRPDQGQGGGGVTGLDWVAMRLVG